MAATEKPRNLALVGCLARAGWSAENLAHHVNLLAASLRLPERVHVKSPRRWVEAISPRGAPSIPRDPWPGLVCAALSRRLQEPVTPATLGWERNAGAVFVPADDGLAHADTALAGLREVVEVDGMDRRHFLVVTGGALTAFAHDWLFDPARITAAVAGRRIDHTVVDDLERLADASRKLDDALGGASLLRTSREHLRLVVEILGNASYPEEVGRRLHAVAAELALIAGNQAWDCDQPATAQRYCLVALRAAHTSDNRALGAHILGFMSEQARYTEPRDALRLAESALTRAKDLTPAMNARLNGHLGMSAAWAGNSRTADRAHGRMLEFTAAVDPTTEPPWNYWWSDAYAYYYAGQAAMALNDPTSAEHHYREALSRLDPANVRARARWLGRLAMARVQLRELEGACRAACEAATLTRRLASQRSRTRLLEFRRAVQPYANATPVKDFDTKHPDLLRS